MNIVRALRCSVNFDLNMDASSIHPSSLPEFVSFSGSSFCGQFLCFILLFFTPVQLESAFCSIHLARWGAVIAISYSQATSPQPDESEECSRHADLSCCPLPHRWLCKAAASRACAQFCSAAGQWGEQSSGCIPASAAGAGGTLCLRQEDLFTWPI